MAAKKETRDVGSPLSSEEQSQVQHLLTQYHQIAEQLRTTTSADEARAALTDITNQPESVQSALLKSLARERQTNAADILAAFNALSPHKELRKEARRALQALQGAKVHAQWRPPVEQNAALQPQVDQAPRFWQGLVSLSREQGEVQLMLCWEQGYDYSEVRIFSFLLDFWHEGVKDASFDVLSKRRIEERLSSWRASAGKASVKIVDCTLGEARRLIKEALAINEESGNPPSENYRRIQQTVNALIFQAPASEEDRGHTFIESELEPAEVVLNFIGAWSFGDFALAYDLLSSNSDVRDNLTRAEWISLHYPWHKEAHPTRLELGFVHEREAAQSALWLPSHHAASRKEIEVGWSAELLTTPLSGTLKEMPLATAVNKETGRHWFSNSFTLARDNGVWRIQSMKDEGAAMQALPLPELQKRVRESEEAIEQRSQQRDAVSPQDFVEELSWRLTQLLHLYDALIIQLPLDYKTVEQAYAYAVLAGNPERMLVYLERLFQRFPEHKLENQRRLAATLIGMAKNYDQSMQPRARALLGRAEALLRELITEEDIPMNHALFGEFLLSEYRSDEAREQFQQALALNPDPEYRAYIEVGLGHIAMREEQIAEGITHYQRVVEINPRYPGIWFALGFAHRTLGQLPQAEKCYQEAIQTEPQDPRPYTDLAAIYLNTDRKTEARNTLEQAVRINPESAHLHALLASLLFELGEQKAAQHALEEAERLDPEHDTVQQVRNHMRSAKKS